MGRVRKHIRTYAHQKRTFTTRNPPYHSMDRHADLIAPCGMNCGICSSYLAGTRDIKTSGVRMPVLPRVPPEEQNLCVLKKALPAPLRRQGDFLF